ncbi:TniQ protein [Marivirga sericea]|uniref:TniQ protein n=1 Tax=Marivirga sericea TaxID=1028 RepID=A0A1X7KMC4_9BACT|nr:TniQ family protein [Marivirga sericea]SMG42618.1 TniQ protein [Marivirga sericea]
MRLPRPEDIIQPILTHSDFFDLLPCFTKPKENELFTCWVYRMAHSHDLKVQTFFKVLFGNYNIWNRDIDRLVPDEIIHFLSKRNNIDYQKGLATTLKYYEGKLFPKLNFYGNSKWIMPYGIYHRKRFKYGMQFCPTCLNKDDTPYVRVYWRLSLLTFCGNCLKYLLNKCPKCNSPFVFFRQDVGYKNILEKSSIYNCFNCGIDLRNFSGEDVNPRTLELQSSLFLEVTKITSNSAYSKIGFFEVLHQFLAVLSSRYFRCVPVQKFMDKKFNVAYEPREGGIKNSFDFQTTEIRELRLNQAIWLLSNWPLNFLFVNKQIGNYRSHWIKDMHNPPSWFMKVFD